MMPAYNLHSILCRTSSHPILLFVWPVMPSPSQCSRVFFVNRAMKKKGPWLFKGILSMYVGGEILHSFHGIFWINHYLSRILSLNNRYFMESNRLSIYQSPMTFRNLRTPNRRRSKECQSLQAPWKSWETRGKNGGKMVWEWGPLNNQPPNNTLYQVMWVYYWVYEIPKVNLGMGKIRVSYQKLIQAKTQPMNVGCVAELLIRLLTALLLVRFEEEIREYVGVQGPKPI